MRAIVPRKGASLTCHGLYTVNDESQLCKPFIINQDEVFFFKEYRGDDIPKKVNRRTATRNRVMLDLVGGKKSTAANNERMLSEKAVRDANMAIDSFEERKRLIMQHGAAYELTGDVKHLRQMKSILEKLDPSLQELTPATHHMFLLLEGHRVLTEEECKATQAEIAKKWPEIVDTCGKFCTRLTPEIPRFFIFRRIISV
jgi:hypothetical protein